MYDFFSSEKHLSSGALIASYFAGTEMLFSNMRMHNVAFVSVRCIYFKNYSVIQKFHHVLFCVLFFMNVRLFRQEELSKQRRRVKFIKYKKFVNA